MVRCMGRIRTASELSERKVKAADRRCSPDLTSMSRLGRSCNARVLFRDAPLCRGPAMDHARPCRSSVTGRPPHCKTGQATSCLPSATPPSRHHPSIKPGECPPKKVLPSRPQGYSNNGGCAGQTSPYEAEDALSRPSRLMGGDPSAKLGRKHVRLFSSPTGSRHSELPDGRMGLRRKELRLMPTAGKIAPG